MGRRLLSAYGDYIATYSGEGTITLTNMKTIPCTFEAGQLRNGQIRLLCSLSEFYWPTTSVKRFDGTTPEGYHVSSVRNIMNIDVHMSSTSGTWAAFRLDEMTIQMVEHRQVQTLRFGLTNFIFHKQFTVRLEHENNITLLSIQPIERHDDALWSIPTLRGVDVTCEAICNSPKDTELLKDIVNDLCYLLSVARGTKVQWIYLAQFDENEKCVSRIHAARVAKGYSPLSVFNRDEEIQTFVEKHIARTKPTEKTISLHKEQLTHSWMRRPRMIIFKYVELNWQWQWKH